MKKINVVLAGLGFGGCFASIYKKHPNVGKIGLFDTDPLVLNRVANHHNIHDIYTSFDSILADPTIDAIHLVTPIPLHEEQTIAALEAGKHCACTVPMAISIEGIQRITDAVRKSGKNYMMMETTLYTYQYFHVSEMIRSGDLGKIQFLRGSHYQDMSNWPDYWMGLPPMFYGTHAIAPMVALSNSRIKRTVCFGSGTMDEQLVRKYGNPFPIECALFEFKNGIKGEATRSLFETARMYQEGLFVYGSKKSFEWGFRDSDDPYITCMYPAQENNRGNITECKTLKPNNYHTRLPESIQRFTVGGNYDPLNPQKSLIKGAGGGHHGSHPHLVHEFISSIIEKRKSQIDEEFAGNITAAGICAHASAMENGKSLDIPEF